MCKTCTVVGMLELQDLSDGGHCVLVSRCLILKRLLSSRYWTPTPAYDPRALCKSRITVNKKIMNNTGARTQPCLTPTRTLKNYDCLSSITTLACMSSCIWRIIFINFGGAPVVPRTIHISKRDQGRIQIIVLFPTIFLNFLGSKNHVYSATILSLRCSSGRWTYSKALDES